MSADWTGRNLRCCCRTRRKRPGRRCCGGWRTRFAQPWLQGKNIRLEARLVGVRCPEHGKDANELALHLEYGDMQLKKQPGTCLMCFGDDEQAALQRRNEVKALIERSMAQGGFEVVFQPIYDCAKKRFCTAEALLRLRDEQGEPVRPDEFIPLAEEFGLIVELDWMVLELVCGFLQQNPDLPIEAVSVNFSVQQFEEQDAAGRVLRTLARHGITPSRLKLELTERVLARDLPRTSRVLQQLCDGGVGLYLDDFGTGYSNLASVARLPLEAVKIDKSLLVEAQKSPETALLLDAVVRTFHTMGRRVVLEGLESAGQLRRIAGPAHRRRAGIFLRPPHARRPIPHPAAGTGRAGVSVPEKGKTEKNEKAFCASAQNASFLLTRRSISYRLKIRQRSISCKPKWNGERGVERMTAKPAHRGGAAARRADLGRPAVALRGTGAAL